MKQKLSRRKKGESGSVRDSASGLTKERLKVLDKMTGQPHREDDEGKFDKLEFSLRFSFLAFVLGRISTEHKCIKRRVESHLHFGIKNISKYFFA